MLRLLLRCNYFHFSFRRYWRAELAAVCSKLEVWRGDLLIAVRFLLVFLIQFYLFISVLHEIKEALWINIGGVIAECVLTFMFILIEASWWMDERKSENESNIH
jgi:hypothetical protein